MDGSRFDAMTKSLSVPGTRRTFLGALVAGAIGLVGTRQAEAAVCRNLGSVCREDSNCCFGKCGSPDRTGRRTCTCGSFLLSGGSSPSTTIGVDDDMTVYLNGVIIFSDTSGTAQETPPIAFTAKAGDRLRVVAKDTQGNNRGIDPLFLHCVETGKYVALDAKGYNDCCEFKAPLTFYDKTFTI